MSNLFQTVFGSIFTGFQGLGNTLGLPFYLASHAVGNVKTRRLAMPSKKGSSMSSAAYRPSRRLRYHG